MIRYQKGGAFTPVSWQEAIRYTASKLREIKEKHGPRAIMTTGLARHRQRNQLCDAKVRPRGAEHQ